MFIFSKQKVHFYACRINDKLSINYQEAIFLDIGNRMKELRIQYGLTQQELADTSGKSLRTVKRLMKSLQDKNYIRRESGKRYGKWEVLV